MSGTPNGPDVLTGICAVFFIASVIVFSLIGTVGLLYQMVKVESRKRSSIGSRPRVAEVDPRAKHHDLIRESLRRSNSQSVTAYQNRIYEQVRTYVRSQTGATGKEFPEAPVESTTAPTVEVARGGGAASSRRLFVVVPQNGDPYWIRCNRPIEAMKYCRRVHPNGFEVALWSRPLPHLVKVVDLIGERK